MAIANAILVVAYLLGLSVVLALTGLLRFIVAFNLFCTSRSALRSTPVVHQPTRTTANKDEYTQREKDGFAGISEHQRTAMTLWSCLCTAEARGSNPLGS